MRLLEAAFGYIDYAAQTPPFFHDSDVRLDTEAITPIEGIIEVTLRTANGLTSHIVDLAKSQAQRAEIWKNDLDGSYSVWYMGPLLAFAELSFLFGDYNFRRYIPTSYAIKVSRKLTADELRSMQNILGRSYDHLSVETIDADGTDLPYFSGTYQSRNIYSSAMSNGELWVHYINWWLQDIPEGSLALIDEPEAFLAARGRRPFIDHIATQALRRKLQLIVATHSPEVLARFPLDNIRMCVAGNDGIQVIPPTSLVQIQDIIGMSVPVRVLVLVEDDLAKQLLSEVFAQYDIALTREAEIIPVGGASEVINGLRILGQMNRLGIVGVLDADERGKDRPKAQVKADPIDEFVYFLPGDNTPEEELLSGARRQAAWIGKTMGRTVNDIVVAINSCQSLDHQYQLKYLASQFGRTESAVIFMLTQAWLRNTSIRKQAEKLAKDIRGSMPIESSLSSTHSERRLVGQAKLRILIGHRGTPRTRSDLT
jgi:hypothetical protein